MVIYVAKTTNTAQGAQSLFSGLHPHGVATQTEPIDILLQRGLSTQEFPSELIVKKSERTAYNIMGL